MRRGGGYCWRATTPSRGTSDDAAAVTRSSRSPMASRVFTCHHRPPHTQTAYTPRGEVLPTGANTSAVGRRRVSASQTAAQSCALLKRRRSRSLCKAKSNTRSQCRHLELAPLALILQRSEIFPANHSLPRTARICSRTAPDGANTFPRKYRRGDTATLKHFHCSGVGDFTASYLSTAGDSPLPCEDRQWPGRQTATVPPPARRATAADAAAVGRATDDTRSGDVTARTWRAGPRNAHVSAYRPWVKSLN